MSGKIYTKTGDDGSTSLLSGDRVSKSHQLLEAYGSVDELSAVCGLVATSDEAPEKLANSVQRIQNQLFILGSHLSCNDEKIREKLPVFSATFISALETEIDQFNQELPPLSQFILPGGNACASFCHLARTVCRRAERQLVRVEKFPHEELYQISLQYLNRLSDWFFVASRFATHKSDLSDVVWDPNAT